MKYRLPWTSLIKMSCMVSLISSVLIFAFLLTVGDSLDAAIVRFLEAFLFLWLISISNLLLLKFFRKDGRTKGRIDTFKFLICSYVLAIITGGITSILHPLIFTAIQNSPDTHYRGPSIATILAVFSLNTLILILQNMVTLQHKKTQEEIENLQLKASASEMTNLLLRQQIHPHFLFNSLNTIKTLYKLDLKQGENYLVHLANFLRMAISNQKASIVPIRKELEFCLDYLNMQKIRFGVALDYKIQIEDASLDKKFIPSFSLQPLVENIIKHNDFTKVRPILIEIEEKQGYLRITNNLQVSKYKAPSTGYGLSNLSERYQALGHDGIHIKEDDTYFTVSIKILDP